MEPASPQDALSGTPTRERLPHMVSMIVHDDEEQQMPDHEVARESVLRQKVLIQQNSINDLQQEVARLRYRVDNQKRQLDHHDGALTRFDDRVRACEQRLDVHHSPAPTVFGRVRTGPDQRPQADRSIPTLADSAVDPMMVALNAAYLLMVEGATQYLLAGFTTKNITDVLASAATVAAIRLEEANGR